MRVTSGEFSMREPNRQGQEYTRNIAAKAFWILATDTLREKRCGVKLNRHLRNW